MTRALFRVTLALAMLLAPTAAAEPWLQFGYDAARTGATPDPGPESFDVAFKLALNASRPLGAPPLIMGREAFVLTTDGNTSILHAIDLDTAMASSRLEIDEPSNALASDGARFFVARSGDVAAYPLEGGDAIWTTPFPALVPDLARHNACVEPAVRDGTLFLACTQASGVQNDLGESPDGGRVVLEADAGTGFALALDTRTGEVRWSWDARNGTGRPPDPRSSSIDTEQGATASIAVAHSVIGDIVAIVVVERQWRPFAEFNTATTLWALDAVSGSVRWQRRAVSGAINQLEPLSQGEGAGVLAAVLPFRAAVPTGTQEMTLSKFGSVLNAYSTSDGTGLWEVELAENGVTSSLGGNAIGFLAGSILVTSYSTLYRLDAETRTVLWQTSFGGYREDFDGIRGLSIAGGHVFVRHFNGVVTAVDALDGSVAWRMQLGSGLATSHGEGVTVLATAGGNVTFLGRTAASLVPRVALDDLYPEVGATITADLSGTVAGALGPATEFRAEWGDGTATEWQTDPVLLHRFSASGDHVATFAARNPAGQTASETLTLHVGGAPVTPLEEAFSAENQERTFFLLGLLITLIGAFLATWRVRRRRTLLQRELAAIDEIYARTKEKPATCEAALASARARAHELLVHGKLDEAQAAVLSRHADELAARLRLGLIEERFGYLTVSLARRLRGILEDGRVTPYERAQFLDAIGREPALDADQKAEVRRVVEEWSTRDSGA